MKKNLPKVFASPINKELKNNKDVFYASSENVRHEKQENVPKKINEIFKNPHHVYKSKVHIRTINNEFDSIIVGKTNHHLLTINGEKISIEQIESIERI